MLKVTITFSLSSQVCVSTTPMNISVNLKVIIITYYIDRKQPKVPLLERNNPSNSAQHHKENYLIKKKYQLTY